MLQDIREWKGRRWDMPRYRVSLEFRVSIVVEPDGENFHAFCPALKGLHVSGNTEEEATRNAGDAAAIYLESLIRHKDPIPVGIVMKEQIEEIPSDRRIKDLTVACAI
jgi:predicted RNase H-like HicB family nuclease